MSSDFKKARKISCYENPIENSEQSLSILKSKQGVSSDLNEEKKKVHFVRSHTPKPIKSKAIHHDDDDHIS